MGLSVTLDQGRTACVESIEAVLRAVRAMTEHDLLGSSRCYGWTRLDVVVHVLGGWQEMLGGLVSAVDAAPSVDAASYWSAFTAEYATTDPVSVLMLQRRRTAAYSRPASATAQMEDVASAILRGTASLREGTYLWQGHVFTAGDYLAVWAVEDVVHLLDLCCDEPAPRSGLALARATIEALAGGPLPASWTDLEATLIGTGRASVPDDAGPAAARLPVLT